MTYYEIATICLTLAVFALRKLPGLRTAWAKIPDGYRWIVPTLAGALAGIIPIVQAHGSVSDVTKSLLVGLFGISLPAMGAHALIKDSPIPIDGGAGGK